MVDSGGEVALRWLEGVVSREVDVEEEHSTSVGRVIRSHDGSLPVVLILLINRSSRAVGWRVLAEVDKLLLDSLKSHIKVFTFIIINQSLSFVYILTFKSKF